jgi:Bardet-Biedl syndrome 9 protein
MTYGTFGGVRAKDMIMVQSMDGKLQIFEQSAHAFSRQLIDCLIPGPIIYLPKLDAFVTVNYAGVAECYRYQVLASSQGEIGEKKESKGESKSDNRIKSVKSTVVEWSTSLGETCRQIITGNFSSIDTGNESYNSRSASQANELLFICDKSIFLIKADTGSMIQQRKLDRADASCGCVVPYVAELPNSNTAIAHNFLLAYQDSTVQIFSGFQLTWAAKATSVPVHLSVATFAGQKGLIVSIDDTGYLSVSFLGTKPAIQPILSQVRDLDYDKIDEEHRSLLQIIRDSQSDNKVDLQDKILIKSQISKVFDLEGENLNGGNYDIHPPKNVIPFSTITNSMGGGASSNSRYENTMIKVTIRFYLTYTNEKPATNANVIINTPPNVFVTPKHSTFSKVSGLKTTPLVIKATFYVLKSCLATSLDISVSVSYFSHKNEPQITSHNVSLPLFLLVRPKPPSKNALYKVTLDTEFPAIPLTDLFADVLYAFQEAGIDIVEFLGNNAIQAMGFQQFNPSIINTSVSSGNNPANSQLNPSLVSILVSKNAGRYRIQSDSYPLMYIILSELEKRLNLKLEPNTANGTAGTSIVRFNDNLPLEEYFLLITTHLNLRIQLLASTTQLNDVSQQYRLIEKRLLVRFKDRNPTPLHGLDLLLKETYDKIVVIADEIEGIQKKLKQSSIEIECFSKLLSLLIATKYSFTVQERNILQSYLCPEMRDGIEQVGSYFFFR